MERVVVNMLPCHCGCVMHIVVMLLQRMINDSRVLTSYIAGECATTGINVGSLVADTGDMPPTLLPTLSMASWGGPAPAAPAAPAAPPSWML